MKFSSEKKQTIVCYMLEKIADNTKSVSKIVSDAFGISTNTVHTYLTELIEQGVIIKEKRGQYRLASTRHVVLFKRSAGDLDSDMHAYDICLKPFVSQYAENVQQIWSYVFSEMVNNVMDHSEAEHMKVVVEQDFLRTRVWIMDDGVGIFEKIKNHFSLSSLDEAICELVKGKLTTDESNHSGEGIFFSSKMMDTFLILSSAKVFSASRYRNDRVEDVDAPLKGTGVCMALSNFTHKTSSEVFDLYANEEGAFNKTRIPLKNIFDSAPVSRSQAKRICNRLDQFQEVILDFDEVGWMGQGFAHQLFVVYQGLHPNMKLLPIHMNESVTNMYNHVINTV